MLPVPAASEMALDTSRRAPPATPTTAFTAPTAAQALAVSWSPWSLPPSQANLLDLAQSSVTTIGEFCPLESPAAE